MCPARGHGAAAGLALALAQAPGDCQEGRIPQPPELAQTRVLLNAGPYLRSSVFRGGVSSGAALGLGGLRARRGLWLRGGPRSAALAPGLELRAGASPHLSGEPECLLH